MLSHEQARESFSSAPLHNALKAVAWLQDGNGDKSCQASTPFNHRAFNTHHGPDPITQTQCISPNISLSPLLHIDDNKLSMGTNDSASVEYNPLCVQVTILAVSNGNVAQFTRESLLTYTRGCCNYNNTQRITKELLSYSYLMLFAVCSYRQLVIIGLVAMGKQLLNACLSHELYDM